MTTRGPGRPRDEAARERVAAVLADPAFAEATPREIAMRAGTKPDIVRAYQREHGLRGPIEARNFTKPLERLPARQLDLLAQLYATALCGGDVKQLLTSPTGRELHQAVIAARKAGAA